MPTTTYTPLATLTLSTSAASVTFSSISQAYRDLVLVANVTTTANASNYLVINGDGSGTTYSRVSMHGNGTTAASNSVTGDPYLLNNVVVTTSSEITQFAYNFMDYSATDKHKSVLLRVDRAGASTVAQVHRWANTAAITSLQIAGGTLAAGSTFCLYGIAS